MAVGYVGSAPYTGLLSSSLFDFRQAHPDVELTLTLMDTYTQLEHLAEERLDVGFIRPPVLRYPPGVAVETILTEPLIVALRRGHRLAEHAAVPLAELAEERFIGIEAAEDALQRRAVNYDKGGDHHYDLISAWIKATRGSDPDASLYYLAVMLEGGEDARFIARRMVILASEDVGNADPQHGRVERHVDSGHQDERPLAAGDLATLLDFFLEHLETAHRTGDRVLRATKVEVHDL